MRFAVDVRDIHHDFVIENGFIFLLNLFIGDGIKINRELAQSVGCRFAVRNFLAHFVVRLPPTPRPIRKTRLPRNAVFHRRAVDIAACKSLRIADDGNRLFQDVSAFERFDFSLKFRAFVFFNS